MAATDRSAVQAPEIGSQLAGLRAKLNGLVDGRAMPMLEDAGDRVSEKLHVVSRQARSHPLAVLAIVAGAAFLIGRLSR